MKEIDGKVIRIHYTQATAMNGHICRRCWVQNKPRHSFALEICEREGIRPYWRIPHYWTMLRALVKKHYKENHPEWEII